MAAEHNPAPSTTRLLAGVDLGGTKVLGRVWAPDTPDRPLAEVRLGTPRGSAALGAALVDCVEQLVSTVEAEAAGGVVCVGVGVAGLVDREGVLRFGPNLPGVFDLAVAPLLEDAVGLPVVAENDANCALWCEAEAGAARGAANVVMVTLGTGIGAAMLVDGVLVRGAHGMAGEPGHMVVAPDGPPCPCGRRGCWERFASGSGLGRLGRDAAAAGRAEQVVARAGGDPEAVRGEHVSAAAAAGDKEANAILQEFAWWVALGVANLIDILDPELVVIGGGLAQLGDALLDPVRAGLADLVVGGPHRPPVAVMGAAFGPEAGAIGAGMLAARALR